MARRIEIELTSARPDGTWTWRAAGALQPRGILDGGLLFEGAKAGDVVRVDAEFEIDGITITAVLPPKEKKRAEPQRLEVLGPTRENQPGVTASLAPRSDRRRAEGPPRGPRRTGEGRPTRTGRPPGERTSRGTPPGAAERPSSERPSRPAREGRPRDDAREATGQGGAPRPQRSEQPRTERRRTPSGRDNASARPDTVRAEEPRTKARRLNPGNSHRTEVLESLVPEQRPVAEQVLRGGIPAVRTALHLEREKAAAEGRPAPNAEALIGMAEDLLPRLKAAEWRDRAEAAAKVADEIALRDLRSVVAGADVARDEEGRRLAALLREALERRVTTLRDEWLADVRQNLEEGRVVRALRLSGRPPDPASRVPADLASHLADAAGQALAPDTPADRWSALLEAVALSPVRRNVKPVGLPEDAPEDLLQAARQSSGRIPALASLLGIPMPPPPGPVRPVTARPGRGGSRPAKSGRPSSPRPASGQGERRGTTKPGPSERTPAEPDTTPAEPPPDEARAEPTTAAEARPDVTPTPPSQPAVTQPPPEPTTAAEARPDVAPTPPAQPDVTPTPPTTQHDPTPTPPVTEHEPTPEAPRSQAELPAEANPEPEAAANGGDAQPAAAPPRAG